MAAPQENLEERIERIRKRDEELEKKHREAEEDRLAALKDNAMVKTKTPTSEDWPKGHRYDKYDFSYDNRDSVDGGGAVDGGSDAVDTASKGGRDYKKFADGQGPPPDPSYNFLADAERDGNADKAAPVDNNKMKDWRQPPNGVGQQQPAGGPAAANGRSRGGLNNSFKGRNASNKGPRPNGNQQGGGITRSNKTADSAHEFNQWKSERERIDEARIGRQKLGDGKWRREWDNEKNHTEEVTAAVEKIHINQAPAPRAQYKPLPLEQPKPNANHNNNNNYHTEVSPKAMEKRGNLMVSVSKDGEVKSVKLQSNRAIGTGRVGPRQTAFQAPYPSAQPEHDQFPVVNHFNQPPPPIVPNTTHYYQQAPQPPLQQSYHQNGQPPATHYAHPEPIFYDTPRVQPAAARPFNDAPPRPNLQDRLARHRQPIASNANGGAPSDNLQQHPDGAQIAVGY